MKLVATNGIIVVEVIQTTALTVTPAEDGRYDFQADTIKGGGANPDCYLILPDDFEVQKGDEITQKIRDTALPLNQFIPQTETTRIRALEEAIKNLETSALFTQKEVEI